MNGMPSIPSFTTPQALIGGAISFGGAALISGIFGKTWGIVNEYGVPILLADTFASMNYDAGAQISKYPTEQGKFASYNKVDMPSMATVQMIKGGDSALTRGLFLTQLEQLKKSTLAFHIITPEYVYMNFQIIGLNHARSAQSGATMIAVNIDLEEVLEAKVEYSTEEVAEPSDSTTVDGGAKESKVAQSGLSKLYEGGLSAAKGMLGL